MAVSSFKLDCCRLFDAVPLYEQRKGGGENGKYTLHVMVVGYGERMGTIFNSVLTHGQLLDTELCVTVVVPNPKLFLNNLIKTAPALTGFVRITHRDNVLWSGADDYLLADIRLLEAPFKPETVMTALNSVNTPDYVIVSGGNDEKNFAVASALSDSVKADDTIVAAVRRSDKAGTDVETGIVFFGGKESEKYGSSIEKIAFNLHYAYAKGADERKPYSEIKKEFEDPYIYVSNIEAAACIKSKLACCGISVSDLTAAAQKFARLISKNNTVVERLGAVEHARWVIEKTLQGYRPLDDIDRIYQNGDSTKSTASKWHSCLVPSDRSGQSSIQPELWKKAKNRGADKIDRAVFDVDDLDRVSLRIHSKCAALSNSNLGYVDGLITTLRNYFTNQSAFSEDTRSYLDTLEGSITQMRLKKRSAINLYRQYFSLLCSKVDSEAGDTLTVIKNTLNNLRTALKPLIEYISFKDYKEQDRLLVRSIPFALTHISQPSILKVLSEIDSENILSAWLLEPASIAYLAVIERQSDLFMLDRKVRAAKEFIRQQFDRKMPIPCYLIVPESIGSVPESTPDFKFYSVPGIDLHCLTIKIGEILNEARIDYIDLSGKASTLEFAVQAAAEQTGSASFYIDNGTFISLSRCSELEYPAPEKNFSVREMFKVSGGKYTESGAKSKNELYSRIKPFWETAGPNWFWTIICSIIDKAYQNSQKSYRIKTENAMKNSVSVVAPIDASTAVLSALRRLEDTCSISTLSVKNEYSGMKNISFAMHASKDDSDGFATFLRTCFGSFRAGDSFKVKQEGSAVRFIHNTLCVCGICVGEKTDAEAGTISAFDLEMLRRLNDKKLLFDLEEKDGKLSFRFANEEVRKCMTVGGALLEYYVYYSALMDASFTDVDIGFKYQHSTAENSPNNEIDVICTRGARSLFISCKHVSPSKLADKNLLNYFGYEIRLQAELFGVNAKPVLVVPSINQFSQTEANLELSKEVRNAMSRGVYLIGKECLVDNKLGKVLENIIADKEDWCDFLQAE